MNANNSFVVIKIVSSLLAVWGLVFLYDQAASREADGRLLLEGFFFWYLGSLFFLSKRLASVGYLFAWIDFFCREWAVVGGRYRAWIYGSAFWVVAAWRHFQWLYAG